MARRIHRLHQEDFLSYDQMAIFFRVNAQSRVLEEALRLARVPYALVSGRSFYERAEIRDAASYLRLMVNPRSDADLLRIVNVPARGHRRHHAGAAQRLGSGGGPLAVGGPGPGGVDRRACSRRRRNGCAASAR